MSGDTAEDAQSRAEDAEADEDTDNDEPILSGSGGVSKVKLCSCLNLYKTRAALNIFNVFRSVRSWSLPAGRRFCTPGRPEVRGRGSWRRWCGRGCPRRCGARSGSG